MSTSQRDPATKPAVRLRILVFAIAILVVVIDQLTKIWALKTLTYGKPIEVLGEALQWVLIKNPGAAFSFLEEATWVFTIVSSVVTVVIIVVIGRIKTLRWAIVGGLVLAGAVGNLIDRIFREPGFGVGHVVDFIFTPWIVPAVYNMADMAIVFGMGLFLLFTFLPDKKPAEVEETVND